MRIQEDQSRCYKMYINGIAESPNENRKELRINYIECCTSTLILQKEWLPKERTEMKSEKNRNKSFSITKAKSTF